MTRVWYARVLDRRLLLVFVLILLQLVICQPMAKADPPSVGLSELITDITAALVDAKRLSGEKPYFLVKEIQMELQVIQLTGTKGELVVPVLPAKLSLVGEVQTSKTQTFSITLKPSKEIVVSSKNRINFSEVIEQVKKFFRQEREQRKEPYFVVTNLEYKVQFLLQEAGKGKIDFLFVNIEGGSQTSQANKLALILCETVNLRECAQ